MQEVVLTDKHCRKESLKVENELSWRALGEDIGNWTPLGKIMVVVLSVQLHYCQLLQFVFKCLLNHISSSEYH